MTTSKKRKKDFYHRVILRERQIVKTFYSGSASSEWIRRENLCKSDVRRAAKALMKGKIAFRTKAEIRRLRLSDF